MEYFTKQMYRWLIVILLLFLSFNADAVAQDNSDTNLIQGADLLWYKASAYVPVRVITPENYDTAEVYPALLSLHGFAGNSEKFSELSKIFADAGFITIVPEAPYPVTYYDTLKRSNWEMSTWTTPKMTDDLDLQMKTAQLTIFEFLPGVINRVEENYSIGSLYTFGFSLGGVYALLTGFYHRYKIEGVIAFGAEFDESWFTLKGDKLQDGSHVPIYYVIGDNDPWFSVEKAEQNRDLLKEAGYDITLDIFEGAHKVDRDALKRSANWLKKLEEGK